MNVIGNDVIKQALVVRDDEDASIRPAHGIDTVGHNLERVDIEPAVGFVQHSVRRREHGKLQDFVALLFAA